MFIMFTAFILANCSVPPDQLTRVEDDRFTRIIGDYADFSGHVIIADQSSVLFNKTYGEAGSGQAMSYTERWRWASVTKQIVAVAVMQMVEEGHFGLDTEITDVLSDTDLPNAKQVTIRNLLQHTSGLINDEDLPDEAFINGFDSRAYCTGPAKSATGENFEYNNCDYIILGQILESVDKRPWFESLNARIFSPAGMTSLRPGLSNNGNETVSGWVSADIAAPPVALELYEASGGIVGRADELLKFNRALLAGELIAGETRAKMWDSDPSLGYAALGQWVFPAPLKGCETPLQLVERRGAISGIQVLNVLVPDRDMSVIVFVNRDDFDWGAVWTQQGFAFDLLSAALCDTEISSSE